jgi:hypothetical protein
MKRPNKEERRGYYRLRSFKGSISCRATFVRSSKSIAKA